MLIFEGSETMKRARDKTETETEAEEIDSSEVKRLREDLLDGINDLDSFMKSFEEEITTSLPLPVTDPERLR